MAWQQENDRTSQVGPGFRKTNEGNVVAISLQVY